MNVIQAEKRPVAVEAVQWDGSLESAEMIIDWVSERIPQGYIKGDLRGQLVIDYSRDGTGLRRIHFGELSGSSIYEGFWVVSQGELTGVSVVSNEYFNELYRVVEEMG